MKLVQWKIHCKNISFLLFSKTFQAFTIQRITITTSDIKDLEKYKNLVTLRRGHKN